MKKTPLYALLFFLLLVPALCSGGETSRDAADGSGGRDVSVKYRVAMRDLDRGYQTGLYTRTEYVQRKREIEALYGGD